MYYRNRNKYSSRQHIISDTVTNERTKDSCVTRIHSHTSVQVSKISDDRSRYSKKHARHMVPAFTSLRRMVKPEDNGITIVNVYNNEKTRRRQKRHITPSKVEEQEAGFGELPVTRMEHPCCRHDGNFCMTTDQDRVQTMKQEELLPRWHQREEESANHDIILDNYNTKRAKREWDEFYESVARTKTAKHNNFVQSPNRDLHRCQCKAEEKKSLVKLLRDEVKMKGQEQHAMGAFYGTAETQRICQNAIQQVLKCERELQQLAFTTSSVLPQITECLAKVRWVYEFLKLFHTNFRDLQAETDEKLQKKMGNHFTIKMKPPPKYELPFPKHMR